MSNAPTPTQRHIAAMEGVYRRRDRGQVTGRNSNGSDGTLRLRWRLLADALAAGGFEELDANERLAARYSRIERRFKTGARS